MEANVFVNEYERIDDLRLGGLRIIQNPEWFCFGIDSVLLSNFSKVKRGDLIVEFGTGTGIIPLLLAGKTPVGKIKAFEIQEEVAQMAARSVEMNGLTDRIEIISDSLENAHNYVGKSNVDVVITNPPYFKANGGIKSENDVKMVSRHEVHCTLDSIISSATSILKPGGSFFMVHRPDRLVDIIWNMKKCGLEPKEIRFVQPSIYKAPNILLIKGVRGGGSELRFHKPLIVYKENGEFSDEIFEIYKNERIEVFEG